MFRFNRVIADSTVLRTVYFIRIKSPFALSYNLIYPLILTAASTALLLNFNTNASLWDNDGIVSKLLPVLSLLFPFYVAALAAVSTFPGKQDLDEAFPPDSRGRLVTLAMRGANGVIEPIKITQRHFLSLLFGYCSVVSVVLLMIGSFSAAIVRSDHVGNCGASCVVAWLAFGIFMLLFFQMVMLTLLSIYYLGDKIHRQVGPTGDDFMSNEDDPEKRS